MVLKQSTVTFGVLAAAFAISALVLTGRRWAWWVVSVLVLALLSVGVFWYYPVVVPARIEAGAMGPVGWLEASVYMGLLFVAGFLCVLNALGAPGPREELAKRAPRGARWSCSANSRPQLPARSSLLLPPSALSLLGLLKAGSSMPGSRSRALRAARLSRLACPAR